MSLPFINAQSHATAAPVVASGVSCYMGFDLHQFLGYAGQIIGIVSGALSILWVAYQWHKQSKGNKS